MKGGLLIKPEYKITEAFITFIKHSKINIFKSGSNGIIFKCNFKLIDMKKKQKRNDRI